MWIALQMLLGSGMLLKDVVLPLFHVLVLPVYGIPTGDGCFAQVPSCPNGSRYAAQSICSQHTRRGSTSLLLSLEAGVSQSAAWSDMLHCKVTVGPSDVSWVSCACECSNYSSWPEAASRM